MNSRTVRVTILDIVGVALLLTIVQILFTTFYVRYAPVVLTRGDDWRPYFFVEHYLGLIWAGIVIIESVLLLMYWNYRYPSVLVSQFHKRPSLKIVLSGVTAAGALFALAYALGWPIDNVKLFIKPIITEYTSGGSILSLVVFVLVLPVSLEVVFRGVLLDGLRRALPDGRVGNSLVVIGSAALFAYCWPFLGFFTTFLWGVSNAILLMRTDNLWGPILMNATLTILAGAAAVDRIQ